MEPIYQTITAIPAIICMGKSIKKIFPLQQNPWKRFLLYILLYTTFCLPSWIGDENPILMFPFFMVGFLVLLAGNKLPKLVVGGIFYAILISLNMLVDSLLKESNMNYDKIFTRMFIKMFIWIALSWLILRIVPEDGLSLSRKLWLLLGGLILAPLIATLSFSFWGNPFSTDVEYYFYLNIVKKFGYTILPFVFISALTLLLAAVVLSRHETLEQESKMAALREVYYSGLKQEQNQLRTLRHDLRNHITALQGLLEQDKQSELAHYLTQLSESPALGSGKSYTDNEIVNIVLSSKASQMETVGLVPNFTVQLPKNLPISAPDLCALFGNALDNAIEGASDAKNHDILLRAKVDKGLFILQVQNEIGSVVNADLSTTKTDTGRHGFGLTGMQEIAVRHGGSLNTTVKNGLFELFICFPC